MQLLPGSVMLFMRRVPRVAPCGLVLAVGLMAGCSVVSGFAVSNSEYVAYRKVRTSSQLTDRLAASEAYLASYPSGLWADEVFPWHEQAELAYWKRAQTSQDGLEQYLRALPTGPHAAQAAEKLAALLDRKADDRIELLELSAATTEERFSEWSRQRDDAREVFTRWLGRALSVESWGQPTGNLPHEVIFNWRIDPPKGTCQDDYCIKSIQMEYRVPGGGDEAERIFLLDVVLLLESGRLQEVRLQGSGLFSRLYEVGAKRTVRFDDPQARRDAISYAVDVVGGAAEARLPAARCTIQSDGLVALHRSCEGLTVRVEVAASIENDDVVSIHGTGEIAKDRVDLGPD